MTNPNFHSTSRVILMCGPAGSGKSTVAQQLEGQRLVRLSFDEESFQRGIVEHPLAQAIHAETVEWLDDAFLVIRFTLDGEAHFVIGRSDANDAYRVLLPRRPRRMSCFRHDLRRWALDA
jgi:adenylate kinase family enzyme